MNNTAENLDYLTYQMTDEEIYELGDRVFESNKKRYGIINIEDVSDEVYEEMSDCLLTIPKTRKLINSFVKIGLYSREELEEENRKLYAERKWEQYL